jgi:hypothetical protein
MEVEKKRFTVYVYASLVARTRRATSERIIFTLFKCLSLPRYLFLRLDSLSSRKHSRIYLVLAFTSSSRLLIVLQSAG